VNEKLNRLKQRYDPNIQLPGRWQDNWGPEHDYVAPGYDPSDHPIQRGEAAFEQYTAHKGLNQRSLSSLDADVARAETYDQEPLPGQWLYFGSAD
jgi:hypothetical protein